VEVVVVAATVDTVADAEAVAVSQFLLPQLVPSADGTNKDVVVIRRFHLF
jgi:hypothetical protein